MIIDFIIGVMLMGSLFHLSFAIWRVAVLSPLGSSPKSNAYYGTLVFCLSIGLYLYRHGWQELIRDNLYLGALFALVYTILFGLWTNRKKGP